MKRLSVLMVFLLAAAFAFTQSPGAQIRTLTGTVELKAPGSADWVPAKAGDLIEKATVISTGFKSMATLDLGSSTLMVRPLTRLSLNEIINQGGTETINVAMSAGRVRADVKPPAEGRTDFAISTTVATASVRGTIFDIDRASIRVIEGIVLYSSSSGKGKIARVGAGQKSQIDEDSGYAQNPMVKADIDRVLPAMAGQASTSPGSAGGSGLNVSPGAFDPGFTVKPITVFDPAITVRPKSRD